MKRNEEAKVETVSLKAHNGRHVRRVTKVTFVGDGWTMIFTERMNKRDAIEQAAEHRLRERFQD